MKGWGCPKRSGKRCSSAFVRARRQKGRDLDSPLYAKSPAVTAEMSASCQSRGATSESYYPRYRTSTIRTIFWYATEQDKFITPRCPLWVIRGHCPASASCLLYPDNGHSSAAQITY